MPPMSNRNDEETPYARMLRSMAKRASHGGDPAHAHNLLNMANRAAGRAEVFGSRSYIASHKLNFD